MGISIGKYEFDGPHESIADLQEREGIYAILHFEDEEYELIHVAESYNIKGCIELSQASYSSLTGSVLLAAFYTERSSPRERRMMVQEIQNEFDDESTSPLDEQLSAASTN